MSSNEKQFNEIIQDFDDAMMVTATADGTMRARPMKIADVSNENELWFATGRHSTKVDEILEDNTVAITLQGSRKYLSLSGSAKLITDERILDEKWQESWKIWFSKGKKDPEYALLKIIPSEGEYWDYSGLSGIKFLLEAGKSFFAGRDLNPTDDINNAHVNLS